MSGDKGQAATPLQVAVGILNQILAVKDAKTAASDPFIALQLQIALVAALVEIAGAAQVIGTQTMSEAAREQAKRARNSFGLN